MEYIDAGALAFLPRFSFASRIIYSEYFVRDNSDMSSKSLCRPSIIRRVGRE